MELTDSNGFKPKTHVLLAGIALLVINTGMTVLTPESSAAQQILFFLLAIGFNVLTLFWCIFDSRERGEQIGRYFPLSVVIFGAFALFYYFFKTRGFRDGLILMGKFIALLLGTSFIAALIFAIIESIFQRK